METCLDSLTPAGSDLELIVIDDGSAKDNTWEIARSYEERYPDMVRAVHQENGGYGTAVNTGLRMAKGLYFAIIDSDDYATTKVLLEIISKLKELESASTPVDLFLSNYYVRKSGEEEVLMHLHGAITPGQIQGWKDLKHFSTSQYIMIHNIIYRTKTLKSTGLVLPPYVSYSDNLLVMCPLPKVKTIYYMDVNYYNYVIGRPDQSVNENMQIQLLDQQLLITRLLIDHFAEVDISSLNKKLYNYMVREMALIMATTSLFLFMRNDPGDSKQKNEIWNYLKKKCPHSYPKIRSQFLSVCVNLPGVVGRKVSIFGYKVANKKLNLR